MIADLLLYLFRTLFGSNLKPVPVPPLPSPEDVIEEGAAEDNDLLDPVSPVPTAPQIIVPKPENEDRHGPASSIARALIRKGHAIFEKDDETRNLNIVAIRTATPEFDRFRCRLVHFDKHQGNWDMRSWTITTLPGHRYTIDRLLNPKGAAILAPGQYQGVYRIDRHRGIYDALCQRNGPVRVFRDGNRNRVYDMDPDAIMAGMFGINVHATENPDDGISRNVADRIGSASAGCLVFARVTDFTDARKEWWTAKTNWGANFTVTLIDENDLDDIGTVPIKPVQPQHSDKEAWHPPGPGTVGTRNRNLLNVKQGMDQWKYSTGEDSRGHAIFPNFAVGLRAGIITLRSYWQRHRRRTIRQIVERWAPSTDTIGSIAANPKNDPGAYAKFISRRIGVSVDELLRTFREDGSVRDADQLFALVAAMVEYENGQHVKIPRELFDKALALL